LCGKTFTESCKLKRHLARVHKANKDGNSLIPGQPVVNARKKTLEAEGEGSAKMAKATTTKTKAKTKIVWKGKL
jgi:hypothetical protein